MASEQKPPAGAAVILIDDMFLHDILNLPPEIKIHHSFVPNGEWGKSLGLVIHTDTPGLLPEYKAECEPVRIQCLAFYEQIVRVKPIWPEESKSDG